MLKQETTALKIQTTYSIRLTFAAVTCLQTQTSQLLLDHSGHHAVTNVSISLSVVLCVCCTHLQGSLLCLSILWLLTLTAVH